MDPDDQGTGGLAPRILENGDKLRLLAADSINLPLSHRGLLELRCFIHDINQGGRNIF